MGKIPVFLLTGFLGAGKSTLLNRLLREPAFADTAIVINEFGDIPLDHDLVRVGRTQVSRTTTGCLCCTAGSDIRSTLHELQTALDAGEIAFDRVIVETTGLADPAPLVNQLIPGGAPAVGLRDHVVARKFELSGVITLVDIVLGELSIENHFEVAKQIAFADHLLLTKGDLARDPASIRDIEILRESLVGLNPAASITSAHAAHFDPASLFQPRAYVPGSLGDDVAGWLALEGAIRGTEHRGPTGIAAGIDAPFDRHGGRIKTFAITRDGPVQAQAFRKLLEVLAQSAGPRLLRVKGLMCDQDTPERPKVVHVVQHVVHQLLELEAWPSDDRRTRLVFITDDLDPEPVRELVETVLDGKTSRAGMAFRDLVSALGGVLASATSLTARI